MCVCGPVQLVVKCIMDHLILSDICTAALDIIMLVKCAPGVTTVGLVKFHHQ